MRPRFMNRGSYGPSSPPRAADVRFNEAPIHESGKWRRVGRVKLHSAGFNEAPIHESGKFANFFRTLRTDGEASMRPRFMNRGSSNLIRTATMLCTRFNEAPIHESGK